VRTAFRSRPVENGTGGTTVELMVALAVVGASVLTALVLGRRRTRAGDPGAQDQAKDRSAEDDANE